MSDSLSVFKKRCIGLGVTALVTIVIISIIMTAAILDIVLGDYFNEQFTYRSLAPLAWLIPLYPCFAALNRLKNMLFRFSEGEVFTPSNAGDLTFIGRNFALTVLLMVIAVPGIYSMTLYGWNGSWWVDLEPGDSASFFLSLILWLFGWLISEGTKLQSENESFV